MKPAELEQYEQIGRGLDALVPICWQKRAFDLVLSFVLLVLCLPLVAVVGWAMLLEGLFDSDAQGPFFLTEPRGSEGRVFLLPKFRIVRMGPYLEAARAEEHPHIKALERNPANLTRVGAFLKRFYLDEVPQLFSILIGHMSFVGPRPWPLEPYRQELEKGIFRKRLIRPGLTGLVQARKGTEGGPDEWTLDYAYIGYMHSARSGWSKLFFDLRIMLRSVRTFLEAKGL